MKLLYCLPFVFLVKLTNSAPTVSFQKLQQSFVQQNVEEIKNKYSQIEAPIKMDPSIYKGNSRRSQDGKFNSRSPNSLKYKISAPVRSQLFQLDPQLMNKLLKQKVPQLKNPRITRIQRKGIQEDGIMLQISFNDEKNGFKAQVLYQNEEGVFKQVDIQQMQQQHTSSDFMSINEIIPPENQNQIKQYLAQTLKGINNQNLQHIQSPPEQFLKQIRKNKMNRQAKAQNYLSIDLAEPVASFKSNKLSNQIIQESISQQLYKAIKQKRNKRLVEEN